jgi:hypothetical protein
MDRIHLVLMRWRSVARRDLNQIRTAVALRLKWRNAAVAHLKKHNVKFHIEPLSTPICRIAMTLDPDSNSVCIHK